MKWLKKFLKILLIIVLALMVLFFVISLIPIKKTVEPMVPRNSTEYWLLKQDHKIAYTKISATDTVLRSPVIFLHGGPGGYITTTQIKLADSMNLSDRDVYLYDQIGSGLSDRLERPHDYSLYRHVHDLHEILTKQIGAKKCILVGQSFGGIVAAHYAATYPETIEKLILTCPGDLEPYMIDSLGEVIDIVDVYPVPAGLTFKDVPSYSGMVDRTVMHPRVIMSTMTAMLLNRKYAPDGEMDALMNNMATKFMPSMVCNPEVVEEQEGGGGGYARLMTGYDPVGHPDVRMKLKQLKFPVLVMQGQCDQLPFAFSYEYIDLFSNSEYHFVKNAGHDIWLDRPRAYYQELSKFIADTKSEYSQEIVIVE